MAVLNLSDVLAVKDGPKSYFLIVHLSGVSGLGIAKRHIRSQRGYDCIFVENMKYYIIFIRLRRAEVNTHIFRIASIEERLVEPI